MLRALRILFLFFPVLVFAQVPKTDLQLANQLQNLLPNNTQKLITPANARQVIQDGYDARVSIYGEAQILGKLTYNSLFPITNDGDLIYKGYLDARLAGMDSTGGGGAGVTSFEGRIGPVFLDSLDLVGLAYPRYSNPSGFLTNINPTTVRNMFSQGTGITYSSITGQISFSGTTSNVPEGSNLYFTAGRVKALFASSPTITFNSTTGTYSIIGLTTLGTAGQQVRINTAGTGFEYFTPGASLTTSQAIVLNGPDVTGTGTIGGGIPTTITNNAVTTAKINNGAVTIPKMSASGTPDATKFHRGNDTWSQINYTDIVGTPTGGSQVQSDYTQSNSAAVDFIKNKPTLSTVAGTGQYSDLIGKPTIPAAQIQSDWNQTNTVALDFIKNKPAIATQVPSDWNATTGVTRVLNKPTLSTVATSGSYNDLLAKPTIPAAQINSDWNATTGLANILNKPNLSLYELTSNKVTNLNSPNNTTFPTTKAVQDALDTLAAHSGGAVSGVELTASEPLYTSGSGSGLCYLLGSDGLPILGSDGIPLSGPCGGFAINIRYADSSTAGIITAAKYRYLSNLDLNYVNKASTNVNPTWITSLAKSKITGLIDPVNPDWNSIGGLSQILNKPTIPAAQVNSDWNANSGLAQILNKPSIPLQLNAIQGANITITGAYPNLTFSASGSAQVPSDWNASSGVARILNKPSLSTVATTGDYNNLINLPSIPAAQVSSDWSATSGIARILNKPTLSTVATTGAYADLTGKPTIPAAQVNSDWNATSGITRILNKPIIGTNIQAWDLDLDGLSALSGTGFVKKTGTGSYTVSPTISGFIPVTGTPEDDPVTGTIKMVSDANFSSTDFDVIGDGSVMKNNVMKLQDPGTGGISFYSPYLMDYTVEDDFSNPGTINNTNISQLSESISFNANQTSGSTTTNSSISITPGGVSITKLGALGRAVIANGTTPYIFESTYFDLKRGKIYPPVLGDSSGFKYVLPSKSGTIALKSDIPTGGGGSVSTVSASVPSSTAIALGVTNASTTPSINLTYTGNNTQLIRGDGTLATIPSGGGSSLTINNNVNGRVLLANGGTTSIDGSGALTIDAFSNVKFSLLGSGTGIDKMLYVSSSGVVSAATMPVSITSFTTTGSGAATFSSGALNIPTPSSLTTVAFGSTPNSNGGAISGNTLTLQPADATRPGGVINGDQNFGTGRKTLGAITVSGTKVNGGVNFGIKMGGAWIDENSSSELILGSNNGSGSDNIRLTPLSGVFMSSLTLNTTLTTGGNATIAGNADINGDAKIGGALKIRGLGGGSHPAGIANLVSGTETISDSYITTNSLILLTPGPTFTNIGRLKISAQSAGQFTITSSSSSDTGAVNYIIIEKY